MTVTHTIKSVNTPVFTKRDISQIIGIPETRITNWEAGRTIKLKPSILKAAGRGTRNLYSLGDVYKSYLAIVLLSVGYSGELVQQAIDEAPGRIEHEDWLFVEHPSDSGETRIRWSRKPRLSHGLAHAHVVNLANIREAAKELIRKESKGNESL
jgi:hypothetical protein